ncbi:DUF1249 domain-containing protein [Wenzhouxiangella marina]|uniref:Uncharacterized protein n=1 Tax=Wenzhouxiangella marina TaxID=1579979 RepID=A0A0K0XW56_9GAMM|nr:DUF1249 domain-containing protein [Wenzhouxiangella marina]AKS41913.1 hypothetical protein WM2015_1543 [Wenzhouxiangella marina]MBB6086320.1 hypothetical protein [Wenzhouxiangella marina]
MLTTVKNLHPPTQVLARRLPELHTAVFRALNVLMPDGLGRSDCLVSRIDGCPDLYMQVIERHDYTTFLRLTYLIGDSQQHNPNAHIRVYHDARMAEATAFSPEQGIQRLAGPELPMHGLVVRNWRLNRALLKWLDYLLAQGHSAQTLQPAEEAPLLGPDLVQQEVS